MIGAILLAGGSGTRFGGDVPKQLMLLGGRSLIDRAADLLEATCDVIVVALAPAIEWSRPGVTTVPGGATRTESVRHALDAMAADADVVVVHDCIRPFTTRAGIAAVVAAVRAGADAAVPVWQPPDTVKRITSDGLLRHVGREELRIVSGPAAFRAETLRTLYATHAVVPVEETIVLESMGARIVAVPGDSWSHHVVDRHDLAMFEALLASGDPLSDGSGAGSAERPR